MLGRYKIPLILLTCWLVIHIVLLSRYGVRELHDAAGYVKGADHLLHEGEFEDVHHIFYALPVGLIALTRIVFPGEVWLFLIIQCLIAGVAAMALADASIRITRTKLSGLIAGLLYLLWWDNTQWNTVVMTESLFASTVCFIVWALVRIISGEDRWIMLAILCIVSLFIRPTSVVVVAGVLVFVLVAFRSIVFASSARAFVVIVVAVTLLGGGATLMSLHWDFTDQYVRGNIVTYMDVVEGTNLYSPQLRLDTSGLKLPADDDIPAFKVLQFIVSNPLHFLHAASLKIFYLLTAVRPYYSQIHNVYSVVWLTMIYLLSIYGFRFLRMTELRAGLLAILLFNVILVGVSTVDWDNRFFVPMIPPLVLLSSVGLSALLSDRTARSGYGTAT